MDSDDEHSLLYSPVWKSLKENPLSNCLPTHQAGWNLHALLEQAEQPDVNSAACAVVQHLPQKLVSQAKQELQGLPAAAITLSVALCTYRRGRGGRHSGPDPALDPRITPERAQRILNNRRTAAVSKILKKVKGLAELARQEGVLQPKTAEETHPLANQQGQTSAVVPEAEAASFSSGSHGSDSNSQKAGTSPAAHRASAGPAQAAHAGSGPHSSPRHMITRAQAAQEAAAVAAAAGAAGAGCGTGDTGHLASIDGAALVAGGSARNSASPAAGCASEAADRASMSSTPKRPAATHGCGNPELDLPLQQLLEDAAAAGFCRHVLQSLPRDATTSDPGGAQLPGFSSSPDLVLGQPGCPASVAGLQDRQVHTAAGAAATWPDGPNAAQAHMQLVQQRPAARRVSYDCAGVYSLLPQLQQWQQQVRLDSATSSTVNGPQRTSHSLTVLASLQSQLEQAQKQMRELVRSRAQLELPQRLPSATTVGMRPQILAPAAPAGCEAGGQQATPAWVGMGPAGAGAGTHACMTSAGYHDYDPQNALAGGEGCLSLGVREGCLSCPARLAMCSSWGPSAPAAQAFWGGMADRRSCTVDQASAPLPALAPAKLLSQHQPLGVTAGEVRSDGQQHYDVGGQGNSSSSAGRCLHLHKRRHSSAQVPEQEQDLLLQAPGRRTSMPDLLGGSSAGREWSADAGMPSLLAGSLHADLDRAYSHLPAGAAAGSSLLALNMPPAAPWLSTAAHTSAAGLRLGVSMGDDLSAQLKVGQVGTEAPTAQHQVSPAHVGVNPDGLPVAAGQGLGVSATSVRQQCSMQSDAAAGSSRAADMDVRLPQVPVQSTMSLPLPDAYAGARIDQYMTGAGFDVSAPTSEFVHGNRGQGAWQQSMGQAYIDVWHRAAEALQQQQAVSCDPGASMQGNQLPPKSEVQAVASADTDMNDVHWYDDEVMDALCD